MRPKRTLALLGALLALAAVPARGSDPVTRPGVGTMRPPQEPSNLGYLFPDLEPVAGALLAREPAPIPIPAPVRATATRDEALVRTQVPAEDAVPPPGRMPRPRPRAERPANAPQPAPRAVAPPGTEMPGLPSSGVAGPFPPRPPLPGEFTTQAPAVPTGVGQTDSPTPEPKPVANRESTVGQTDSPTPNSPLPTPEPKPVAGNLFDNTVPVQPGVLPPPGWEGIGFDIPPPMIGDQAPFSLRPTVAAAAAGLPPLPPSPFAGPRRRPNIALPWARGFKIADNMSPRPMDRFFFTFNYFNNLDGSINNRIAPGTGTMQAYRYIFGYEKTFWDGNASLGARFPIDNLTINGQGTSTAINNLTLFSKLILLQQRGTGNLLTGGLALTLPTGPAGFAGAPGVKGFRDTQIQPFLGYYWNQGRWYVQGFESIDVPTDPHDVTMIYNDIGIGYYAYRNADPHAFLTLIAPTFETHVNVPLNHVGAFRAFDPAGTPNVVDLTFGVNFLFRQRSMLTFAFIDPATGPRPFSQEWTILFNYFFGRTQPRLPSPMPPVAGL